MQNFYSLPYFLRRNISRGNFAPKNVKYAGPIKRAQLWHYRGRFCEIIAVTWCQDFRIIVKLFLQSVVSGSTQQHLQSSVKRATFSPNSMKQK